MSAPFCATLRARAGDSRIANVRDAHEELERIHLVRIALAPLNLALDLALALLAVRSEAQVLPV